MTGPTEDLTEHLLATEALPPEWQDWLEADGVPGEAADRAGSTILQSTPMPDTPWRITGDSTATWALRKVREAEAELTRIQDAANAEFAKVEDWTKRARRRHVRTAEFFRNHLREYLRALIEDGQVKLTAKGGGTYTLPTGNLTRRAGSPSVEFYDEEAFIAWALDNRTELVNIEARKAATKESLLAKELPADDLEGDTVVVLLDPDTGEVVPGVRIITGEATDDAKPTP